MRLFDGMKTFYREMTVNENVESSLSEKDIKKEVEYLITQQTRNLKKLSIEVSNDNAIPKKDDNKNFIPKETVSEKRAEEAVKAKESRKEEDIERQIGD